jgi:hypothetical protein
MGTRTFTRTVGPLDGIDEHASDRTRLLWKLHRAHPHLTRDQLHEEASKIIDAEKNAPRIKANLAKAPVLDVVEGRTPIERRIELLRRQDPKLTFDAAWIRACEEERAARASAASRALSGTTQAERVSLAGAPGSKASYPGELRGSAPGSTAVEISGVPGANLTAKAVNWCRSNVPGFLALDWGAQVREASRRLNAGELVGQAAYT